MAPTQEGRLPPILRLPDELLDSIISTACSISRAEIETRRWYPSYKHTQVYETPASLRLVCRRFNRIAVTYMFDDLDVWCTPNDAHPGEMAKVLHRSCRENPSLWPLCRRLTVSYRGRTAEDDHWSRRFRNQNPYLYAATDLITWFTATTSFKLQGLAKEEKCWTLLQLALKYMRELTELSLRDEFGCDLCLPRVVDMIAKLGSDTIRVLQVDGVSREEERRCRATLQGRAGSASFTTLTIRNFFQTPGVLKDLIRWPVKLKELDFEHTLGEPYSDGDYFRDWRLATLQPILSIHKSTLRSIKICAINRGGLAGFDMRQFVALETLSLSHDTTYAKWKGAIDEIHFAPNLIAPRLRVFHWDMAPEGHQSHEELTAFEQPEEDFLRAIAKAAVAQGRPLRIDIEHHPEPGTTHYCTGPYPWDRMGAVERDFQQHGIRVSYNKPTISREEYLEALRDNLARLELKSNSTGTTGA